jgi:RNA polymerase sigma-70 factor (ECF subfamily)
MKASTAIGDQRFAMSAPAAGTRELSDTAAVSLAAGVRDAPAAEGLATFDVQRAYAEHAAFISRVIQRLVGDTPQVDDLLQETFIVAFKKRNEFRRDAAERTWLYAIAARLCMRHRRGARRRDAFRLRLAHHDCQMDSGRPDRELEREQSAALVRAVLDKLSFVHREVFVLYELEGLAGAEIAELLGVPVGTVWTRLHHARDRFQNLMRKRLSREAT